ncbi:hypothetical protein CALVIDRAFT_596764 [Calocera viscosa TUFC12733]|uniref:Uncharacterized protein n=1 Tax=Calocera viscosa (strain TUFC12733) TaxID=1330018 RepID=A0A167PDU5_CALVF|nr:hypothetical protein CALVIDRAFT_596764 [Calocera viscosa TUFC12733]
MSFLIPRLTRQVCLRAATRCHVIPVVAGRRTLRITAIARAKQKDEEFDPFADDGGSDDLFGSVGKPAEEPSESSLALGDIGEKPPKNKRARKPGKEADKTRKVFRKLYEYIAKILADDANPKEREEISPRHFRKLIQAARVDVDWVRTEQIIEKWRMVKARSEVDMEKLLMIDYWILRRNLPMDKPTGQVVEGEASEGAEEGDQIFQNISATKIEPASSESQKELKWELRETSGSFPGRQRILFHSYYDQLMTRIPSGQLLLAPKKNLLHMITIAKCQADLEKIVEVLKLWRRYMGKPDQTLTQHFITRCQKLLEPQIAVEVLSNHATYGMDLVNLKQVHEMFQAILQTTTLNPEASVSAAFELAKIASGMPWRHVMQDPLSSMLLISICHRASKSSRSQTSMEKGAQVLEELQIYLETRQKGQKAMEDKEKVLYHKLGFVNRPKGLELSEKEKKWREKSVEAARQFALDLGLDASWLVIPEASKAPSEEVRA